MAKKNLYINDVSLGTYGIYISSDTILNSPSFDYAKFEVPGRIGSVLQYNNRLNNVIRKFTCYVPSGTNVNSALGNVKKLIYANPGYVKLASDYEAGIYMYGYLAQEIKVDPFNMYRTVTFDLYFSCQPQKYFATSTIKKTDYGTSDLYKIQTRSGLLVSQTLNNLPADAVPSAEYYELYHLSNNFGSTDTVTNITASNSNGDILIVINQTTDIFIEIVGYGYGSVSIPSYSVASGNNNSLILITPVSTNGVVTGSSTISGTTKSVSFDPANFTLTATEPSAMGASEIGYEFEYEFEHLAPPYGSHVVNPVILTGFFNNQKTFETMVAVYFENMNQSLLDEIFYNYTDYDNAGPCTVQIDKNLDAYVVYGTKKLKITTYAEIVGTLDNNCDTIKATFFRTDPYLGGSVHGGTLKPSWWSL